MNCEVCANLGAATTLRAPLRAPRRVRRRVVRVCWDCFTMAGVVLDNWSGEDAQATPEQIANALELPYAW